MHSREYELFVKSILEKVSVEGNTAVEVQHDQLMVGATRTWQIDLSYSFTHNRFNYTTAIECKCWDKKVDVNTISHVHDCIRDCGYQKGVVATTVGFTRGAIELADKVGIGMLIVADDKEPEWHNFTGKEVAFDIANETSNWFTSNPTVKVLSGQIQATVSFVVFLAHHSRTYVLDNLNALTEQKIMELPFEKIDQIVIEFETAEREYFIQQTGGLPLELRGTGDYSQNYESIRIMYYMLKFQNETGLP